MVAGLYRNFVAGWLTRSGASMNRIFSWMDTVDCDLAAHGRILHRQEVVIGRMDDGSSARWNVCMG